MGVMEGGAWRAIMGKYGAICGDFCICQIVAIPTVTAKNNLFFKNHCFLFCGLKKSI